MKTKQTLLERIATIDPSAKSFRSALKKIGPNEFVAGPPLGEVLQKLYCVRTEAIHERNQAADAFNAKQKALYGHHGLEKPTGVANYAEMIHDLKHLNAMEDDVKLLDNIFWSWVMLNHPELRDKESIAIREGYTLIYRNKPGSFDERHDLMHLFAKSLADFPNFSD
jgi:hypothetical protein